VIFVSLLSTPLTAQQKRSALSDLSSSAAVITKLDWLMIKTQVEMMISNQPVSDVGWPTYHYDKAQKSLWATVFVNPKWWQNADINTVKQEFSTRGMLYCTAVFNSDSQLASLIKSRETGCEVYFYTLGKTANRIDLATYLADKSELILK
jgi:hypothetical protein